ncbi:cation channel sperm-associated auxiliary subunit beta-like [Leucoraja erinacea]|uniref:cation channel sperm-associated auxiliary subunit beta-like n=1 Tax=Leucoraja erinaceus TaxID=7782 RepID=UPI00245701B0|nr:cation channel sperm-associated auxiliary subunit beta-like [Leucoraja erinacea]
MDWMSSIAIIIFILCNLLQFLNFTDPDNEKFRCTTEDSSLEDERIRLYLHSHYLNVSCSLYFVDPSSEDELMNMHVPLYTSVGMIPSLEIFNRSSKYVFDFERTLTHQESAWHLSIPREELVLDTDVFPADEWYVKVKLYYGTLWQSADGTLLDVMREPILQWNLGTEIHLSEIIPFLKIAYSLKVVKRLCASDVSILAPLFYQPERLDAGIFLLVTKSAFTSMHDKWYDIKPVICALITGVCQISLLDIIMTNRHLVLLTSRGLFISEDMLFQPGKDLPRGRQLTFFRSFAISEDEIYKIILWHTEECFAQKTDMSEYISITEFTPHNNLRTCRFSLNPFKIWNSCLPPVIPLVGIIATIWDNQRKTIIILSFQTKVAVTVCKWDDDFNILEIKAFQQFYFPDPEFSPTGLFLYPTMYYLYAYGTQVWYSKDGGNSFKLLLKLKDDNVIKAIACPRTNAVIFITDNNVIYYTRPGLARYSLFDYWRKEKLAFSCDHYGTLMKISFYENSPTGFTVEFIDHKSLIAVSFQFLYWIT